jgi:type I restriction enzyme S subunit
MEKKNVPEIRFPEFTGPWVMHKMGELISLRRGLTYSPSDINENGIRVLRSSNIDDDTFIIHNDDVFVNQEAVNIPKVKVGDILITAANGSSKLIGKHAIITDISEGDAVPGGFMLLGETRTPSFANAVLSTPWYDKFLRTYAAGGNGAISNLKKNDLERQIILLPSEEERKYIGGFYKLLNSFITKHQRQVEVLKQFKKGMLQRMFPREGETIPSIRFPGFNGPWKSCRLGEIVSISGRIGFRGYTTKDIVSEEEGGVLAFSPSNIVDNRLDLHTHKTYITKQKYDESPEIQVSNGDILFVKTGSTLGKSALITSLREPATVNPQIVVIRTDDRLQRFMSVVLSSNKIQKQVTECKIGGAVPTLTETEIKKFRIDFPTEIEEGIQIGELFAKLDCIGTLYQHKLNLLKQLKKGLLQKMFI